MIRMAICDDEKDICSFLEEASEKYLEARRMDYSIDVFYSADALRDHLKKGNEYEIIFLDIEMDGLSGIQLGEILRNDIRDDAAKIIYVSWQESYALELFKIRPLDFLIKPLTMERVEAVLELALRLLNQENDYFVYQQGSVQGRIKISEIVYFSSTLRKIAMRTVDEEIVFAGKLDDLVKSLDEELFWRIHKSFIINQMNVKRFEYNNVKMIDGSTLPISQSYRVDIRNKQKKMLK